MNKTEQILFKKKDARLSIKIITNNEKESLYISFV
jgi:hypothetical protein